VQWVTGTRFNASVARELRRVQSGGERDGDIGPQACAQFADEVQRQTRGAARPTVTWLRSDKKSLVIRTPACCDFTDSLPAVRPGPRLRPRDQVEGLRRSQVAVKRFRRDSDFAEPSTSCSNRFHLRLPGAAWDSSCNADVATHLHQQEREMSSIWAAGQPWKSKG